MLLAIEKTYESSLSVAQVEAWLDYVEAKESGAWIFTSKTYDVKRASCSFVLRKKGSGRWGPIYPSINGWLELGNPFRIRLRIKPSYSLIMFCVVVASIFFVGAWACDVFTINGVKGEPSVVERFLYMAIGAGIPTALCYFKVFLPMFDAEGWLVKKLALRKPIV